MKDLYQDTEKLSLTIIKRQIAQLIWSKDLQVYFSHSKENIPVAKKHINR